MRPIDQIYPELRSPDGGWYGAYSYQPLLDSLGHRIIVQVDGGTYQGDSYLLLGAKGTDAGVGVLIFGWGSCPGCDELEACQSERDIEALRQRLYDSVTWMPPGDAKKWLTDKRDHEWYWHESAYHDFVDKALDALGGGSA